ncbi:MAG: glycosyltransferase family 2 protein [Solirubrobacterales bacterium]|nr:glycosyltransferase family 2 protein [Solirubrobacterales bacterium]
MRASPRCGVAAPRLLGPDGATQPNAYRRFPGPLTLFAELCLPVGFLLDRVPRLDPYRHPPGFGGPVAHATGAALAIRRAAYDAAGPFDEGYFLYLEETEWQRRVWSAGWTVEAVPGAEVVHLVRGGEEADLAPSPWFLASTRRYLGARPRWLVEGLIAVALLGSRAFLAAMRAAIPGRRALNRRRAAAWRALWADRRRGPGERPA